MKEHIISIKSATTLKTLKILCGQYLRSVD